MAADEKPSYGHDDSETQPTNLPLDAQFQKQLEELRPLSKYKLHYANPEFPVLSFLYAVLAGGEFTLYCDHTSDYLAKYLGYEKDHKFSRAHRLPEANYAKLKTLFLRWESGRHKVPPAYVTPEEWKVVLEVLYDELATAGKHLPMPLW
jgi:hypothetical protein